MTFSTTPRHAGNSFAPRCRANGVLPHPEARHPVVKLLWLACVATSVTLASVIIYNTFLDWRDTPAVVTSVRPTLATVGVGTTD